MSQDMLGNSALALVAGPLKDFAEKLGGPQGIQWLIAFKRFLRREEPWPYLRVWKTIKLGLELKDGHDFRTAFGEGGFVITEAANLILDHRDFMARPGEIEIDLAAVTVEDLVGRKEGGTTTEIFAGAASLGLIKCPPEVGPRLRLQYENQPSGEDLYVGMEPIASSIADGPSIFKVSRAWPAERAELSLGVLRYCYFNKHWEGHMRMVFMRAWHNAVK